MYWWDLRHSDETMDPTDTELALACGSWAMAAGVAYKMQFHKYPRGAIHGLARNADRTAVLRGQADIVTIYESVAGAPYAQLAVVDTDDHARFVYRAAREKGRTYLVFPNNDLSVVNRSYTWADYRQQPATGGEGVATTRYPGTEVDIIARIKMDTLEVLELDDDDDPATPVYKRLGNAVDTSGNYDSPGVETDGPRLRVYARNTSTHELYRWYSDNYGRTWNGPVSAEPV
jgi:hypothetical protein